MENDMVRQERRGKWRKIFGLVSCGRGPDIDADEILKRWLGNFNSQVWCEVRRGWRKSVGLFPTILAVQHKKRDFRLIDNQVGCDI